MCGISAIIESGNIAEKLHKSIKNLEYRGYDSCGVAILHNNSIKIKKNVGDVDKVNREERFHEMKGSIGIAHTRWATHGGVTKSNSHPHVSCNNEFAVVHNGIIDNFNILKESLMAKGHQFTSYTDTEVIAHLLEENYKSSGDVEKSLGLTLEQLEGDYAFAFITVHKPDRVFCARNMSALVLGVGTHGIYLGSDFNAFLEYTRNVIYLEDGEYAIFGKDFYTIKKTNTGEEVQKELDTIPWDVEIAKKGGFPHYMLKEIHEGGPSLTKILNIDEKDIDDIAKLILKKDLSFCIGVGTTYYVALAAQYFFHLIAGHYFPAINSDEFLNLVTTDENTFIMAISQSGETKDILRTLKEVKSSGAATSAIVNAIGSSVYRTVDKAIFQGSGAEVCVLSTKAALAQLGILTRIAISLAQMKGNLDNKKIEKYLDQLHDVPAKLVDIINELSGKIHTLATKYSHIKNWFFIGRGVSHAVALESALKFKEVTYLHAEGMSAGFLKHGTIAMIDQNIFTVAFMPSTEQKDNYKLMRSNIEEIRSRNGFVIGIHSGKKEPAFFDEEIILPADGEISLPFMQLITGQMLSYFTAVVLKRDVDKPRNLAKSVTVD